MASTALPVTRTPPISTNSSMSATSSLVSASSTLRERTEGTSVAAIRQSTKI